MGDRIARFRPASIRDDLTGAAPVLTTPVAQAAQIGAGQIDTTRMAVSSNGGFIIPQATTTDTTNYITVTSFGMTLSPRVLLFTPVSVLVKHTAANALIGLFVAIFTNSDGSGVGMTTWNAREEMSATPGTWHTLSAMGWGYPDTVGVLPGVRYIYLVMRNYTAGTLTVSDGIYDLLGVATIGY